MTEKDMGKQRVQARKNLGYQADEIGVAEVTTFLTFGRSACPHHILGGDNWQEFNHGFLEKNPKIKGKIMKFYNIKKNPDVRKNIDIVLSRYQRTLWKYQRKVEKKGGRLKSDYPIWVITESKEMKSAIIPMLIPYQQKEYVFALCILR